MQIGVATGFVGGAGNLFFPEHFNEPPVKDLMTVQVDPTTGVPSFQLSWSGIDRA